MEEWAEEEEATEEEAACLELSPPLETAATGGADKVESVTAQGRSHRHLLHLHQHRHHRLQLAQE